MKAIFFVEIVNGTSVLPEQVLQELMKFPDFKVIKNAKVHTVSDENNRSAVYECTRDISQIYTFSFGISTVC